MEKKIESLYTWEQLAKMEVGTILRDWFDEGVRCIILRSRASLCAYVGIPLDHPLAGFDYEQVPIPCHYGLTFSDKGDGDFLPENYYWYGWDYAHSGDYCFYDDAPYLQDFKEYKLQSKKWLVEDVAKDMWSPVYDLKILMKLAEAIKAK